MFVLRDAGFLAREQRGTQAIYSIVDEMVMELCALAPVETFAI